MPHRRYGRRPHGAWMRDASMLVLGLSTGAVGVLAAQRLWRPAEDPDVAHYLEVRRFVIDEFVEEVDPDELVKAALKGMVRELDDYSYYYDETESRRVDRETTGRFLGIGAVFRGPLTEGRILFPRAGSPAEAAGLRVGDRIVAIDGAPLAELDEAGVRAVLEGEPDSLVTLEVVGRDGEARTHQVRRSYVIDPTVRDARLVDEDLGIGYISISAFSHETREEFDRAFESLLARGMRSLVLDLRDNPGGVLGAAVEIARRFVGSGVIVTTRGRSVATRVEADPSRAQWTGFPLVVLVDENSASASEVLAGALQDHRAAVLVGTPTHGKGMVQTISRYPDSQAIVKITTSHYYTPSERNLERDPEHGRSYGIVPDLEVAVTPRQEARIRAYARRYAPPEERLEELRAWEREEGVVLVEEPPEDPQLAAALALFRGERPLAAAAPEAR